MKFPPPFYRWRPHPWHGLEIGPNPPSVVHAYIEITPFDMMKYEIDKTTGYLRIDRPQRGSSHPPALYGFIPRTYCDKHVAKLSSTERVIVCLSPSMLHVAHRLAHLELNRFVHRPPGVRVIETGHQAVVRGDF